jgi:hypothetical protein
LATLVELEFALSQFRAQCQSTAKAVKWEFLSQEGRKRAVNVEAEGISHLITLSLSFCLFDFFFFLAVAAVVDLMACSCLAVRACSCKVYCSCMLRIVFANAMSGAPTGVINTRHITIQLELNRLNCICIF